jgi:hypothetical protein
MRRFLFCALLSLVPAAASAANGSVVQVPTLAPSGMFGLAGALALAGAVALARGRNKKQ